MKPPSGVFDIETEGWDRFFCGALLTADGNMRVYDHRQERNMISDLLHLGTGDLYAHNGGRFDFLWALDAMIRFGYLTSGIKVQAVESGASIITLRFSGEGLNLSFRDSWRMFPVSLKKIGGKEEVGVDCEQRREECREAARIQKANGEPIVGCGGYCAIRRGMRSDLAARVRDYCAQDCRALWDGLTRLIAFAEGELDLSLAGTTGATAWKTARDWGLIEPVELTNREWFHIREAYFGGRVGLFQSRADQGWHYDITSSYPHQTGQPLPTGRPKYLADRVAAGKAYRASKPGVYTAAVKVPRMHVPPLPFRAVINGDPRNAYPTGSFTGCWTLPELEYAESIGCKVTPHSGYVFPGMADVFRPLMEHLIGARLRYGKETAEGALIKLWANSLYGKFAQEPRTHRLIFCRSSFEAGEGAFQIDHRGYAWLVPYEKTPPLPESSHVEKAAYITSRGRIQLHQMLTSFGGSDAIYCDTDSVFSLRQRDERHGVRKGLGGWADEGRFRSFRSVAPKLYRYDQENPGKRPLWTPVLRAKGIALPRHLDTLGAARAWDAIESGKTMHNDRGVLSLRSTLRRGGPLFARKDLIRTTSGEVSFGDRFAQGRYGSRPPRADELTPAVRVFDWR